MTGVLLIGYVINVGGDFMHGRMMLPGLFCLLLPVLLVPMRPRVAVVSLLIVVWAVWTALFLRVPDGFSPEGFIDERRFWLSRTAAHLVSEADWRRLTHQDPGLRLAQAHGGLVYRRPAGEAHDIAPLRYHEPSTGAVVVRVLDSQGVGLPNEGLAIDGLGLSYPLAAHQELTVRGRPGHEKEMSIVWILADYTPDGYVPAWMNDGERKRLVAARHALRCGDLAELQHAVRDRLTAGRFIKNILGSVPRTVLRYPPDPIEAERRYCDLRGTAGAGAGAARPAAGS